MPTPYNALLSLVDCNGDSFIMSDSSNKRLKTSEPSHDEVIEFDSLPAAKQEEFRRLSDLMLSMETDEDARSVFDMLKASPELAHVVDRHGYTLLHDACDEEEVAESMLETIRHLVELFPHALQHQNVDDMLPLHVACQNESLSLETIQFLVNEYPEALEEKGALFLDCLPLHFVCENRSCSLDIVQYLVEQCPKALEEGDWNGDLPLHSACRNVFRSLNVIRYLVERNPKTLRHKNAHGYLPLHLACRNAYCSLEVIRCLLEQYPNALKQKNNYEMLLQGWIDGLYKPVGSDETFIAWAS